MSRIRLQAACDALGLTARGVQAMAARGEIPGAAKIGRVWTFDAALAKAHPILSPQAPAK